MPEAPTRKPPVREVRSLDELQQFFGSGVRVVDAVEGRINNLAQVVGRDVGCHTDGDPLRTVDQEVGIAGGEHGRLLELARVVVDEVDGVLVDPLEKVSG